MNNYGGTPRDRFDPRLFEMQTREAMSQRIEDATTPYTAPCCRREGASRSRCGDDMPRSRCAQGNSVSCMPDENKMTDVSLAMVFSPHQHWRNLYDEETGLTRGTIFEELDKPFHGPACMGGGCNG